MSGIEWVVDAHGCSPDALSSPVLLRKLFERIILTLQLRPVGETQWHQFPNTGGITGFCLLAESHLACHTFPEHQSVCLNLFCCVPRAEWGFEEQLRSRLGASRVSVRRLIRSYEASREAAVGD